MNRPLWRWWLFCVALAIHFRLRGGSRAALAVVGWAVRPEWLASPEGLAAMAAEVARG